VVHGRLVAVTVLAEYAVQARNIDPTSDNKIHDDDVARQLGFSGALVPGVELFAYLTHPLVEAWGADFLQHGRIDVRFRQPVYDGELVVAHAVTGSSGDVELELRGPDGSVRSVGQAAATSSRRVDLDGFEDTPLPTSLPAATAQALLPGPLGTVTERIDDAAAQAYLIAIGETLAIYGKEQLVHPGGLLRLVNAVLMRNVQLGPWIHTASRCDLLGVARVPTTLQARGTVTETFERNGNEYVRYDALVLSDDRPVMHVEHTAIYVVQGPSR
jgi:hypothetical protein